MSTQSPATDQQGRYPQDPHPQDFYQAPYPQGYQARYQQGPDPQGYQAPYQQDPRQAPYPQGYQTPYQQGPAPRATGPSWFRIWAVVIGTAVAAVLVVLAVALLRGHSSATPGTTGPSTSTSVPAHPTTPVKPTTPIKPTGQAANGSAG